MKIAIIGAGLGGLSAACLLANKGHDVTIFEKNEAPGGKINQVRARGFRFDTGPSLLTLPDVLNKLFVQSGENLNEYLSVEPVEPICRYFYPDGSIFNAYHEKQQTLNEIDGFARADRRNYEQFLSYASDLYKRTKHAFLFNPLYNTKDLKKLNFSDLFKIDALATVSKRVDSMIVSPHLRQFFKRFPTYNGSSPFQAPATLNVIPHVELSLGGYYIDGGMYQLIEALMQIARNKGVRFQFNSEVKSIQTVDKKVTGVKTADTVFEADLVISNSDASETYLNLLPEHSISFLKRKHLQQVEPSCSGLVLLLGIDRKYEQLSHHNIFFSGDYKKEFEAIFQHQVMPDDPTIYIADTSTKNPEHARKNGSNLFILVNAPYLSSRWNWQHKKAEYSYFIINQLEKRGLKKLRDSIVYQHQITPVDFYEQYRSNKGSIYGTSSNSRMAAFMRPKNKARNIDGLYLVGGSTHPGGGIPLVIQSAFNAGELIERYEY